MDTAAGGAPPAAPPPRAKAATQAPPWTPELGIYTFQKGCWDALGMTGYFGFCPSTIPEDICTGLSTSCAWDEYEKEKRLGMTFDDIAIWWFKEFQEHATAEV